MGDASKDHEREGGNTVQNTVRAVSRLYRKYVSLCVHSYEEMGHQNGNGNRLVDFRLFLVAYIFLGFQCSVLLFLNQKADFFQCKN